MKFSETYGKNYFIFKSSLFRELVYYVDYYGAEKILQSSKVFVKHGIDFKFKEGLDFDPFMLIGIWIKKSDHDKLEEAMEELERIAPLFVKGYEEAKIKILDDIVVIQ